MSNIIGHIIGMDEIHKKKLLKYLPDHIKIIDLDSIQQIIYNHPEIAEQKKLWQKIENQIMVKKKQKKLIGSKRFTHNIDKDINRLSLQKNNIKQNIHDLWKNKMSEKIHKEISNNNDDHILFIGCNIFPKDYRIKVNLPLQYLSIMIDGQKYFNKIIYSIKSEKFASNQIKYYLHTYSDKIVRGTFPLNLLDVAYLSSKYDKFTQFYEKQGYIAVEADELMPLIEQLDDQLSSIENIPNGNVYVATIYRSKDIIPINSKTPIEGFLTKEEAIENIKRKIKKNIPIYIYEIDIEQFQMLNGKLIATQALNPLNEESLLATI